MPSEKMLARARLLGFKILLMWAVAGAAALKVIDAVLHYFGICIGT